MAAVDRIVRELSIGGGLHSDASRAKIAKDATIEARLLQNMVQLEKILELENAKRLASQQKKKGPLTWRVIIAVQ